MTDPSHHLSFVYDGWDGYHRSIVNAIAPLNAEQLSFRSTPGMRSVGELAMHIADGRVDWFRRIDAPTSGDLWSIIESRVVPPIADASQLVDWLNLTWNMVSATLAQWTVQDLSASYDHPYQGRIFLVSRQWTIWRIMCHDIHHGGQLSELLALQGIIPLELTSLGGHLTEPPSKLANP